MDHPSSLAQLVERTTVNRDVSGSIPLGRVFLMFVRVPERSKGLVLGTNVFALAGSNPVPHRFVKKLI